MTILLAINVSLLNPFSDGNVHAYGMSKDLKELAFKATRQNLKQAIRIQVTFILENKLKKKHFLAKYDCFFGDLCVHFEPLLGWQCA